MLRSPVDRRSPADRRAPGVLLVLLLVLAVAAPAVAQSAKVEVVVLDNANDKPLEAASVVMTSTDGDHRFEGKTDKKGRLELTVDDPLGAYEMTVTAPGYAAHTATLELEPGVETSGTIKLLDQATKNKSLAVEAFNAGVTLLQSGQEEESLEKFREAQQLDPELAEAPRLIAIVAANTGDLETASAALERYLTLEPGGLANVSPAAYLVYRARGETDKLPELRGYLEQLGASGDLARSVYNQGVRAVKDGDSEAGAAAFEEAIELDPGLAPAYQSLAALRFNAQDYEGAAPYLDKLLEIDPDHAEGLRMAFFSAHQGEAEETLDLAERWFAASRSASGELVKQGVEQFEANQNESARRLLEVVVSVEQENALAHYHLGRVLAALGEASEARRHLQHFLELAPDHAEAETARQMLSGL